MPVIALFSVGENLGSAQGRGPGVDTGTSCCWHMPRIFCGLQMCSASGLACSNCGENETSWSLRWGQVQTWGQGFPPF